MCWVQAGVQQQKPSIWCLVHQETRTIKNPLTHQDMTVTVNAHYHATASCVQIRDPKFTADQLKIPTHLQRKMYGNPAYKALILQEFGVNINTN